MKTLFPIVISLLVVGCGKKQSTAVKELTPEEKLVGGYELDGKIVVFHQNGVMECYDKIGRRTERYKWKMIGEEVHAVHGNSPAGRVWGINPYGNLIDLAVIQYNGNRIDRPRLPRNYQPFWKKIPNHKEWIKTAAAPLTKEKSAKEIEKEIRKAANKPTGELTKADLEKVTRLELRVKKLTDVKGLQKLTQLKFLFLEDNKLTDVKGLEKLT